MTPTVHEGTRSRAAGAVAATLAAAVFGLALLATPVLAQSNQNEPDISMAEGMQIYRACRTDLDRYCPGIKPGGGRIANCMKENYQKLSDGCKTTLGEVINK
ncbi:cysteine rich repeat-containing protein [Acuticoccus sp. M5D2P5]|uniref:cysteine rich repeat-containing protein n=1 Tax=Acuticoccus kalidii TaxID=2910977 RepID=UPI001F3CD9E2|nr:cysteine rich repeat-containing protein [Acuticoccus kalidii]MCF3936066.1 cysteine rich repeat-containing protein [Acuticoccus kalidii]